MATICQSCENSDKKLSLLLEFAVEITPIISYIGVVFPFMGLISFLFLDDFEENGNISVAIESGFAVSPGKNLLRCRPIPNHQTSILRGPDGTEIVQTPFSWIDQWIIMKYTRTWQHQYTELLIWAAGGADSKDSSVKPCLDGVELWCPRQSLIEVQDIIHLKNIRLSNDISHDKLWIYTMHTLCTH